MGLFGTFIARKIGYMHSSLSNRDLNRLTLEKINELDKDEHTTASYFHQKAYHSLPHQYRLQLQTIEVIEFYLKVKVVRLLEQNKHIAQLLQTEVQQLQREKKHLTKDTKYTFKDTDSNDVKQLKHLLSQKEVEAINRKIHTHKELLRKCEEFQQDIHNASHKNISDYNVIRNNV